MSSNILKIVGFVVLAALVVVNVIQCKNAKKIKLETKENVDYKEKYNSLLIDFDTLVTAYSKMRDFSPEGDTVQFPGTDWVNKIVFERSWARLQEQLAVNTKLKKQLEQAERTNAELKTLTKGKFEAFGGAFTEQIPIEEALPIIETVKRDTGEFFTFEAFIKSRGQLESYEHYIAVSPQVIFTEKTIREVEKIKKKNLLGAQAGVIYFPDAENPTNYIIGAEYGRKWLLFNAGATFDDRMKVNGFETRLGAYITF